MTPDDLTILFKAVAEIPDGAKFFRYVMHDLCGYDQPTVAVNDLQTTDTHKMSRQAGQRDIWLEMRRYIPKGKLIEIEIGD